MTAEDVIFSLDRILNPDVGSPRTWVLEKILGAQERIMGKSQKVAGINEYIQGYAVTKSITNGSAFAPLYNFGFPASYSGRLTLYCEGNQESAVVICREGATPEFRLVENSGGIFTIGDVVGKYCIYSFNKALRIKNRTGKYGTLHLKWEGSP